MECDFERAVCINLARRSDRWARFQANIQAIEWPFVDVQRFDAINGWELGLTDRRAGPAGAFRSHLAVWGEALAAGAKSLLVFEDDAIFDEDFAEDAREFLDEVPNDWEMVYLGGRHAHPYRPSKRPVILYGCESVMRCQYTTGGFAYGISASLMRNLVDDEDLCVPMDNHLAQLQCEGKIRAYCPRQFIVGHGEGKSDVDGKVYRAVSYFPLLSDVTRKLEYEPKELTYEPIQGTTEDGCEVQDEDRPSGEPEWGGSNLTED